MPRSQLCLLLLIMISACFPLSAQEKRATDEDRKLIYMVLWRGCEEACNSFIESLKSNDLKTKIIQRDAKGDKSHFPKWVKEARELNADLIVTWGTSATLGMAGRIGEKDNDAFISKIPLVFMIVSDPIGSRIIQSYAQTGRDNITGTRNRPDDIVYINAIRSYLPRFNKLGMLYNSNEPNSEQKAKQIKVLAKSMNFEVISLPLALNIEGKPRKDDIAVKMEELKSQGVDFIYMGSSSFLRSHQNLFTLSAMNRGMPVLSPYHNTVTNSHALLSVAAKYEDIGQLAAEQALLILKEGKIPGTIPVRSVSQYTYLINMSVARRLNLYPSVEILQFAHLIN
ncbi:ABC transporter substrate-binding protein [Vibrio sp. J1-1]|uniref:ABC transporter substrate-binding protein n=1 Tax=Vibrio sp. J1-1 TaxID=2912251 RepID=UPI001F2746FE|nr:ABC transporter substrate-binding protein [Vibrio sp. J1-1]MBR9873523.1 ABC transporter substrate-binding protein [Vibrionaceae bacterium]MCF7483883.1 ABC transporter substrate-binding protein [Vibrio sp. J1-1]